MYKKGAWGGVAAASRFFAESLESRVLLTTWVVNQTFDGTGPGTLRYAVANSAAGDTITFDANRFNLNGSGSQYQIFSPQLEVAHNLTIQGPGYQLLQVKMGSGNDRLFQVDSGVTFNVSGLRLSNNGFSGDGGVIYNSGTLNLMACEVSDSDGTSGAGVYNNGGVANLVDSLFKSNWATQNGGGVYSAGGTLNVTGCTFDSNTATASGGGIRTDGGTVAQVTGSGFSKNSAHEGAGLSNNGPSIGLTNSTFNGNLANVVNFPTPMGGAIGNDEGTLLIGDCTIVGNAGYSGGGGVFVGGGTVTMNNSVVGQNTRQNDGSSSDIAGAVGGSYNLVGDGSGGLSASNHNLLGTAASRIDPKLAPMGDYGGASPSMPALAGSPVVDAGSNALALDYRTTPSGVLSTDQRGLARVVGASIDMGAVEAEPIAVNTTADEPLRTGQLSLRAGVNLASALAGAIPVGFDAGVYQSGSLHSTVLGPGVPPIEVKGNVTVNGPGPGVAGVVRTSFQGKIFQVDAGANVSITGLYVSGGPAVVDDGGDVVNAGTLTLNNCSFYANGTMPQTQAGVVANGGAIANTGTLSVIGCTFNGNQCNGGQGGAIYNTSWLSVTNSEFDSNAAIRGSADAGAIFNSGECTITGGAFKYNSSAVFNAGAIGNTGTLSITSALVYSSTGTGLFNSSGTANLTNCTFQNNSAGAVANFGTLNVSGGTLFGSTSSYAGGISNLGTLTATIDRATFTSCIGASAGAIYNQVKGSSNSGGTVIVTNSTFSQNSSSSGAAGIWNMGTLRAGNDTFVGNSSSGGNGGGVYNAASAWVWNCTFTNNAGVQGGAVANTGNLVVGDSTLYANSATQSGGGIYQAGGSLTVNNCVVAGDVISGTSPGPSDIVGTVVGSYDLIGDGSGGLVGSNHNVLGTGAAPIDPKLSMLDDYGGPTSTLMPLPGSPLINAGGNAMALGYLSGSSTALQTDQRGQARISNGTVDIGSVEYVAAQNVVVNAPVDAGLAPGQIGLHSAVNLANLLPGPMTMSFDTVVFLGNVAGQSIPLGASQLEVKKDLTVVGPGQGVLSLAGRLGLRIVQVDAGATVSVSGLAFSGGYVVGVNGGAILNSGMLSLTNCAFNNDRADASGGAIYSTGSLTVSGCSFSANRASSGTSIYADGSLVVADSTFAGDTSGFTPVAAVYGAQDLKVTGSSFTQNGTSGISGSGTTDVETCTFSGAYTAVNVTGTARLVGDTINASTGMSVYSSGSLTVTRCTIANSVTGQGTCAGIEEESATLPLVVSGCTFSNCGFTTGASNPASGIYAGNSGAVTVTDSTFDRGDGAAVISKGPLVMRGCTLSTNFNAVGGGALQLSAGANIANCTIVGNHGLLGGGIDIVSGATGMVVVTNCTIYGNVTTGGAGAGIYVTTGLPTVTLNNTIVAGNSVSGTGAASDIRGQANGSNNLIGTGGAGGLVDGTNGNRVGVADPMLAPLDWYGGSTKTMVPKAGSPAIDAGNGSLAVDAAGEPLGTDQRGEARIVSGAVDIGAVEFQALRVDGGIGNDAITLKRDADQVHIDWSIAPATGQILVSDPEGVLISGNGGSDVISLDYTNGSPLPAELHLNGTFTVNGLQGATPLAGTNLEIGRSMVWVSYAGGSPVVAIRAAVAAGYADGEWNGTSANGVITSSAAAGNATHNTGIGWADWADGTGVNATANTIELKYTLKGDANLDGVVDIFDLNPLLAHYNNSGVWTGGDSNYDGVVDIFDLNPVLANYNKNLGTQVAGMSDSTAVAAPTVASSSATAEAVNAAGVSAGVQMDGVELARKQKRTWKR